MVIVAYNPQWKKQFFEICELLHQNLAGLFSIHHVGSTSIEGMFAKPIIDIDIEILDYNNFNTIKNELEKIGYCHEGDLGIPKRESFKRNGILKNKILDTIQHHLYVCPSESQELMQHLNFRNYLRTHNDARDAYNAIKLEIIKKYGNDNREKYVESKETDYKEYFQHIINIANKLYANEKEQPLKIDKY
ncbi:MAG: hypothetical protein A2015_13065 [Spirochaetes bacterium GWF1_31_7]|nr:MAG: hypothetical protein A2Y30_00470 [Spirochaetes bacterium GWE1_32_154]OHD51316.1 MAG: hypothetical protein A2Y29_00915 [Spirochaetes bacterium GWE2_31_10]OHD51513.1 MAG: hypothetical protein A2015_13065 [Spirochaetes bacterium GWF1_31_7]OHD82896.1 MAG: hypothetical protein A2355_07655 [Spirochaetes bacterium RIFOXYB1_FULL_32_8]HBD95861.1 hypothetical protein [Spirochaetia bacterium]